MPLNWITKGTGGGLSLIAIGSAALFGYIHGKWRSSVQLTENKDITLSPKSTKSIQEPSPYDTVRSMEDSGETRENVGEPIGSRMETK
jgi:hypothetical protein